ncbi:MAG: hydrogenase expression/formation protein HypE [Candidatus Moranbacteria bacterium CG_4_8_14_3_um_filter_34_16]|nr:MAG: hydrogenase expression/formation protein HypE [Candidatus Moranbacteria bacterium CG08_land_8_20_14_0_20_34_16]PIW95418.1 MAG: hydrogenase expression/formation protein HypE [Candidatus Moranbacteria bacterium CG_4_8_14_3_um_filter_34_16]PJA89060.1 MAG: hydrogenase expression/formation protein HypE [Candidatus Moranbacteria bacterium CG_4_9_14_3_um_filter_33_15]
MNNKFIELEMGGGGKKSEELIGNMRKILNVKGNWKNIKDDGAVFDLGKNKLVFTTDAFIVSPLFFSGGDIGKIAIGGTINDLAVMGARPIGISLSIVIEEGFSQIDLERIIKSIQVVSKKTGVPIVTGDTKVTEKGKLDKIEITTAGVGLAEKIISNAGANVGEAIVVSGDLGEHAVALLAQRFNYQTKIKSDCQPLINEIQSVVKYLTSCKDPTRGGMAAVLNEMAEKSKTKFVLDEKFLPFKKETRAISELLGIDVFSFPSEGRFVATVPEKYAKKTIKILRKYNSEAKIIGKVVKGEGVYLKTKLGSEKKIEVPRGKLIPRIC